MMRVLQLGPWPPPHGGIQTNLVSIRERLRHFGHAAGVINITRHRRENADEVWYPHSAAATLRLLHTLPYDTIHLHLGGAVTNRVLALALACTTVPGRHAVLSFHSGGYPSSPEGQAAAPNTLRGRVFRRFDRIIAVNEEIAHMFERFGVPIERIRVIEPHGVGAGKLTEPLSATLKTFFEEHSPVLLSVGLLEPEYDLPAQIDLLGSILASHPDAGLVMIGSGSLEADIRRRVEAVPYRSHILMAGDTPHAVTLRAIATADVLLRTTLYDGDAVSVRESLHFGTPVIATDNGMRPAGVHLVPVSDPAALATVTARVLINGRQSSSVHESALDNIDAVLKLYAEI